MSMAKPSSAVAPSRPPEAECMQVAVEFGPQERATLLDKAERLILAARDAGLAHE